MKAVRGGILATVALAAGTVQAAVDGERSVRFDIPEQPVERAILAFSRQAGVPVLFPSEEFADINANPVLGEYQLDEGLEVLLRGTHVTAFVNEHGHLIVRITDRTTDAEQEHDGGETDMAADSNRPRNFLASAIAALFAGGAGGTALGQEAGQDAADAAALEQITVTGSRIQRAMGFETPTPVTVISPDELATFEPTGTMTEALRHLPQVSTVASGRTGISAFGSLSRIDNIDLRGLGANRTLVLLDGARVVPADRTSQVNTQVFPQALVERIDVITGGATAAYGADALAGATNYVLNRQFEGLRVTGRAGRTEMGDGDNFSLSLAGGTSLFERTHMVFSLEREEHDEIMRNRADGWNKTGWFQGYAYVQNPEWAAWRQANPDAPAESAPVPRQLLRSNVTTTASSPGGMIHAPGFSLHRYTFEADGQSVRPFQLGPVGCAPGVGVCTINTTAGGPEAEIGQRAYDDRQIGNAIVRSAGFLGLHHDLNLDTQLFGHFMIGKTEGIARDRRGNISQEMPMLEGNWQATVFVENPFLPDDVRAAMEAEGLESFALRKNGTIRGEGMPGLANIVDRMKQTDSYETWSFMAGVDRTLPGNWHLRAHAQTGESRRTSMNEVLRVDRLMLGLDAVVHPDTGEIVCNIQVYDPSPEALAASTADRRILAAQGAWWTAERPDDMIGVPGPIGMDPETISDCVPINPFGFGNADPAVEAYLLDPPKGRTSTVTQHFVEVLAAGPFYEGIGAGPFSAAVGLNWRQEGIIQYGKPDWIEAHGAPQNVPELGIRGIPAGFTGGGNNLHMFTSAYYLAGQFRVREMFAEIDAPFLETARGQTIAANVGWRYSQYSPGNTSNSAKLGMDSNLTDSVRLRATLSRDMREPGFFERFEVTGAGAGTIVDPERDGESVLITILSGGNPDLATEKADTFTAGVVYRPAFLPGVQASLDYYEISQTGRVGTVGAQHIIDECYHANALCDRISRGDDGTIALVQDGFINVAEARRRGMDAELMWQTGVDFFPGVNESVRLRLLGNYLLESSSRAQPDADRTHAAGSVANPRINGTAMLDYRAGRYNAALTQRFRGSVRRNLNWIDGVDVEEGINRIGSYWLTNLSLGYEGDFRDSTWRVGLNVANLLDRTPPIFPSFSFLAGGTQSVNDNYDWMGRRYSLSLSFNY